MFMLENFELEYKPIHVPGSPELTMRYYKANGTHKGIIMFVHGVSHGAWCWENFVDFFTQKGYDCFAVNLRGHGDNNKNGIKKAKLSDYLEDVKQFIDYCKTYCKKNNISYSKPFLLGHSMGGAIVEQYISDYSQEVRAAILLAPATAKGMGLARVFYTTSCPTGVNTAATVLEWKILARTKVDRLNKLKVSNFFAAKTYNNFIKEVIDSIVAKITKTDNKNIIKRITDDKELEYYDEHLCIESISAMLGLIWFKLNKPNIPVYVIGSDTDAYFPTKSLNKTAKFYGIDEPEIIKGACHDIMLDSKWREAAQSILNFLEKLDDAKYGDTK